MVAWRREIHFTSLLSRSYLLVAKPAQFQVSNKLRATMKYPLYTLPHPDPAMKLNTSENTK